MGNEQAKQRCLAFFVQSVKRCDQYHRGIYCSCSAIMRVNAHKMRFCLHI